MAPFDSLTPLAPEERSCSFEVGRALMLAKNDLRVTWYFAQNVRSINSISHTEVDMSLTEVESLKKAVQAFPDAFHASALANDRCQIASR